ncbi:Nn.00g032600.m01.CDS01 [Neocucurbitaria sp. VM-36]
MSQDLVVVLQPLQPQEIADAALSYLSGSTTTSSPDGTPEGTNGSITGPLATVNPELLATSAEPSVSLTQSTQLARIPNWARGVATSSNNGSKKPMGTSNSQGHTLLAPPVSTSRSLPSLLRYVDHDLMQNAAKHDRPPHFNATCPACFRQWNTPIPPSIGASRLPSTTLDPHSAVTSTFLPLSPCGHWIHYHCLIQLTTQPSSALKDKCFTCNTQLFEWDGITALTLATRTGLELHDENKGGYYHPGTRIWIPSDRAEYEADCALIDLLISQHFFAHLNLPSRFGDDSPDLVRAYYDVRDELEGMKRPQAKWLQWSTRTGYLLMGMLVAIKMRRFLVEEHGGIVKTEGWREFEEEAKTLQGKILEEVHKP